MTTKKPSHRQLLPLAIILVLSLVLVTSNLLIQPAAAPAIKDITIFDLSFDPQALGAEKRDIITWTNDDPLIHWLYFEFAENQSFYELSGPIAPGASWSYNFTEPVRLLYRDFHRLWITGELWIYTIWGDVDGDGDVDGFDLTYMCGTYGATPGDPKWDDDCDFNLDDIIDGFDLTPACGNYGKIDP